MTPEHPRRRDYLFAAAFLACVLSAFFFDVLFLNKTLTSLQIPGVLGTGPYGYSAQFTHRALIDPGGSSWGPRPHAVLVGQQIREGIAPLWNPYMGIGQPLAGNMDSNAFNPLRIALHLDPSPYAWDLFLVFRLFLAGIFAYLFLRAIRLSHLSALFSSLLFMLSGYFIFNIDMHHVDVEVFLPFMLLCYERMAQKAYTIKWGLLCTAAVVFLLTGGQPQSAFLILLIGFAYFLLRIFTSPEVAGRKAIATRVGGYALFHLLGFALAAPLLLPFYEFVNLSFNNHDPRLGHALGLSYNPYSSDLVSFITPYFLGPIHGSWLKDYNWHILARGYIGVTSALLAIAAVIAAVRSRYAGNSIVYFFGASLLVLLAKLYGFPLVNWIGALPVANMVNFGKYMGPLLAFCAAVLAGIGLERLSTGELTSRDVRKAALLLFLLILGTFIYYLPYMRESSSAFLGKSWVPAFLPEPLVGVILLQISVTLFFMCAVVWGPKLLLRRKAVEAGKVQVFVIGIVLTELFIYMPNPGLIKERNQRGDLFEKAPYINILQEKLGAHRLIGTDRILYPDFASAFGIADIRALDALLPRRYMEFVGNFFRLPSPPDRFTGDEGIDFSDQGTKRALNLLGVRYFVGHSYFMARTLSDDVLSSGRIVLAPGAPSKQWINVSVATIGGISKTVLFAHAPSKIEYPLKVPKNASLAFSVGLTAIPSPANQGEGVLFEIEVRDHGSERRVFSRYVNPWTNTEDRVWLDHVVDLSAYAGRDVILSLSTLPGLDGKSGNSFAWSAWGDLRMQSPELATRPIYDREAKVYENPSAFPRAFVVHEVETLSGKEAILRRLKDPDFPLRDRIILEATPPAEILAHLARTEREKSAAEILRYESQNVEIRVEMGSAGYLVLSDLHYPGWNAYVNGSKVPIYQANYILRSIFLDKGTHSVLFAYEPRSFRWGLWISGIALLLIIGLLAAHVVRKERNVA